MYDYDEIATIPLFLAAHNKAKAQEKQSYRQIYMLTQKHKECYNCSNHINHSGFCKNLQKKTLPSNVCINHNKRTAT